MRIACGRHGTGASVLLVTLLTAGIIGLTLASYLWMVSQQHLSVMRSQAWNAAIPVAEAGVEEALTQLQYTDSAHLAINHWTDLTNGWVDKQLAVSPNTYYDVMIKKVEPPIIISTGFVPAPRLPSAVFGAILAQGAPSPSDPSYAKRRILVNTVRYPLLPGAMVAKGHIELAGNNVTTDGFDSGDPNYNTGGKYDRTKSKASGDVATNASDTSGKTFVPAINVGDADIKGKVSTGAAGTAVVGANGSVGDLPWVDSGTPGIKPGWGDGHDNHFDFSIVPAPFATSYATPVAGVVGTNAFTCILDGALNQNYRVADFKGQVYVTGNVNLLVTDTFAFGSGEYIYIAPGATLKVWVAAPTATLGGSGVINSDGYAIGFQYYGLAQNTSFKFAANASYTGTIYAPKADFTLGGGGSTDYDFVGACVVNTVKMNGHYHFHFDEALRGKLWKGYVATSWNEIDPSAPIN
jgi:hypothetical protein